MKAITLLIVQVIQFLEMTDLFLTAEENYDDLEMDDISAILHKVTLNITILDFLLTVLYSTEKKPRDNDAYKLIRYCTQYR